jgi:1-acyl-sn-glycerol-3-phosphate acyltransferase
LSVAGLRAFDVFFVPWRRRRLAGVHVAGLPAAPPRGEPLVLIANHTSWWDGFLLREVHRALRPDARLVTIMLADQLRRFPFFRLMGAEGVQPGSVGSLRALLHRLDALRAREPELVVSFFPQGRIWPADRRPLGFRPGVERLIRRLAPATVLPIGLRIEPLNRLAPTAFVAVGPSLRATADARISVHALEAAVTRQLDAVRDVLACAGENAPARWPADARASLDAAHASADNALRRERSA